MSAPVDYVNNITNGAVPDDNFISINGAVDIDLYGQVSSESSGTRHICGCRRPAGLRHGRLPVQGRQELHLLLNSTVKDKKTGELKSRIRPTLVAGSVATCTRTNTPLCGHRVRQGER